MRSRMTEAIHVAAGSGRRFALVHGVQMHQSSRANWGCEWPTLPPFRNPAQASARQWGGPAPATRRSRGSPGSSRRHLETHRPLPSAAPRSTDILQINIGKKCNQTCGHCHVDAGPDRTEMMPAAVIDACLAMLAQTRIPTLDITGGAPELHPGSAHRARGDGTGLPGDRPLQPHHDPVPELPPGCRPFFADTGRGGGLVALFPGKADRCPAGRGGLRGIDHALRELNELGYGRPGTGLLLDLVTNPVGAFLPPAQAWRAGLEAGSSSGGTASISTGCIPSPTCPCPLHRLPRIGPLAVPGTVGGRLQPRRGRGRDVPQHYLGRIGTAHSTTATSTRCWSSRIRLDVAQQIPIPTRPFSR